MWPKLLAWAAVIIAVIAFTTALAITDPAASHGSTPPPHDQRPHIASAPPPHR